MSECTCIALHCFESNHPILHHRNSYYVQSIHEQARVYESFIKGFRRRWSLQVNLQRKIHNARSLMNRARREDIYVRARKLRGIPLVQPTTDLNEERPRGLSLLRPLGLELPRGVPDLLRGEVIEHNDIGARGDGGVGLLEAPHLDLHLRGEAPCRAGGGNGRGDSGRNTINRGGRRRVGSVVRAGPDVVVLEHRHMAQVMAMRICAADKDPVLLDEAEPRRSLAGAGEGTIPAMRAEGSDE